MRRHRFLLENDFIDFENHLRYNNTQLSVVIDVFFGMLFSAFILSNIDQLSDYIFEGYKKITFQHFYIYVDWLSKNPAGLKLNPSLTPVLSQLIIYFLEAWRDVLLGKVIIFRYTLVLASFLSIFGISCSFAFISDAVRVLTFHVRFFYIYLTKCYFCLLYLMGISYSTMRGKQVILPGGLDIKYKYDVTNISVSVVCFSVLVLVLPTIFLYYILFASVQITLEIICMTLAQLANISNSNSIYSVLFKAVRPYHFPGNIGVRLLDVTKTSTEQTYYEIYRTKIIRPSSSRETLIDPQPSIQRFASFLDLAKSVVVGRLYWN